MFNLEDTPYGFKITATGTFDVTEAEQLRTEILQALSVHAQPFSLLVDIRGLISTSPEVFLVIEEIQSICKLKSLKRTAIIISSPVLRRQMQQSMFNAGTTKADRFIDASNTDDWENQALAWVVDSVEPAMVPEL